MIGEIKKSVSAALYERLVSPFYGALLISWSLWNWKILYVTFFVSEERLDKNKIDWIVKNCSELNALVIYPLASTLIILTLLPFITNAAYWLHLKFIKWCRDQKNSIEMKTLLTTEQSIQIREELINTEQKFDSLLIRKNQEIKELNLQIESLKNAASQQRPEPKPETEGASFSSDETDTFLGSQTTSGIARKIKGNPELQRALDTIIKYIQNGWGQLPEDDNISPTSLAFFEVNHLIENEGNGMFSMTDLGKSVVKIVLDNEFY